VILHWRFGSGGICLFNSTLKYFDIVCSKFTKPVFFLYNSLVNCFINNRPIESGTFGFEIFWGSVTSRCTPCDVIGTCENFKWQFSRFLKKWKLKKTHLVMSAMYIDGSHSYGRKWPQEAPFKDLKATIVPVICPVMTCRPRELENWSNSLKMRKVF